MKTALKQWYLEGGNNAYVQAWLDKGQSLAYTLPSASVISALNTFFDSIDSLLSSAEMIKIYALNNVSLSEIATLNFIDPDLYQSTLVNSPTYALDGFQSNGSTSYVNGQIGHNRRAGAYLDNSGFTWLNQNPNGSATESVFGSSGGSFRLIRTNNDSSGEFYPYGGAFTISHGGTRKGFYGVYSLSGSGKGVRNTSFSTTVTPIASSGSAKIYDLCWANGATPTNFLSSGNSISMRWEGYEITESQILEIRTAFISYMNALGL